MLTNLKKIASLLTSAQRIKIVVLLGVMIVIGIMQVTSVVSILPFLAVLSTPEIVETNRWLNMAYDGMGFTSPHQFLIVLGCLVLVGVILVNALCALGIWMRMRFAWSLNVQISGDLLAKYLSQPYIFFVGRNSSEFANTILAETNRFTSGFTLPLLEFTTKIVTVVCLFLLVLIIEPVVAIVATLVFGGIYATIYFVLRRKMGVIGAERLAANKLRFQSVQEAFGTIKETKLLQHEKYFVERYNIPTRAMGRLTVSEEVISEMPRFALEALAFGGIVILVIFFLLTRGGVHQFLPLLGLYALAGYRIMPALQGAFVAFSKLRFNQPVVELIHRDLTDGQIPSSSSGVTSPQVFRDDRLSFKYAIELRNVSFSYPNASRPALTNISIKIPCKQTVGFCGSTGAGKTTAADIILGLLEPDSGGLFVDAQPISAEHRRSWQRNIGYVPQNIYLADSTIAQNIAYGVPQEQIDWNRIKRSARVANIAEFIEMELPDQYDTVVGERGVRLSGGQRQRIGIARALYHDPEVLVLDEATSALDGITEKAVMEAVRNVGGAKTVIIIAHRFTTVRDCDQIFLLEAGRISASGSYDELISSSRKFRRMAQTRGRPSGFV